MAGRARQAEEGGTRVSSVANAILLMKTFSDEQSELGISALAERLGLAKSTVHRLASTLVAARMLEQNRETGKYRLGLAVFELGSLVRRKIDMSFEAKPWLMTLREQTGETVNLSILDHGGVVCVNFLESKEVNRISSGIGLRTPVHCTAEGKALIAFQPPLMIERIINAGLERRTPRTMIDPAALTEELAKIRVRGYAIDDEEYELGVRGIASPIRDDSGDRKSTRLNSSHQIISYAVFCLKKKKEFPQLKPQLAVGLDFERLGTSKLLSHDSPNIA